MGTGESKLVDWQSDTQAPHCARCNVAFSVTRRRHHCRFCGRVFCNDCCNTARKDPRDPTMTLRACDACFEAGRRQATKASSSPRMDLTTVKSERSEPSTLGSPGSPARVMQTQPPSAASSTQQHQQQVQHQQQLQLLQEAYARSGESQDGQTPLVPQHLSPPPIVTQQRPLQDD
jgi:hypothetical protein